MRTRALRAPRNPGARRSASTTNGYVRRTAAHSGEDESPARAAIRGFAATNAGAEAAAAAERLQSRAQHPPRGSPPAGAGVGHADHLRGSGRLGRAVGLADPARSRRHFTIGRSCRFGPSGPFSTSWNGCWSIGSSGTRITKERSLWSRPTRRSRAAPASGRRGDRERLPQPRSRVALGGGPRTFRARRRTAASPSLPAPSSASRACEQRADVAAPRVAAPVVLVQREANPVDHVVARVVGAGVVARVVARPVLAVEVQRPGDVRRAPRAHHLDDVPEGLPELRRPHLVARRCTWRSTGSSRRSPRCRTARSSAVPNAFAPSAQARRSASNSPALMRSSV